jgi:hypothetical protein
MMFGFVEEFSKVASINEVVEGLEILAKTAKVPEGLAAKGETDGMQSSVGAVSGAVLGPDASPSEGDQDRLIKLGWLYSDLWQRWEIIAY